MEQFSFSGFISNRPDKKGVLGKQVATGTATASGSNTFTCADGTTSVSLPSVTVTGLVFKPSFIYLLFINGTASYTSTYEEIPGQQYPKTVKLVNSFVSARNISAVVDYIKGDISPASVTMGSFKLPVPIAGTHKWIAYE